MKPEYTTEIHVKRLKTMIELHGLGCDKCPASTRFSTRNSPFELWDIDSEPCKICGEFVGLNTPLGYKRCPCHAFTTAEETFKITLEKIKEWEEENGEWFQKILKKVFNNEK